MPTRFIPFMTSDAPIVDRLPATEDRPSRASPFLKSGQSIKVLRGMATFVQVAKQGSFAKAATAISTSKSVVSRQVIELEEWLGVEVRSFIDHLVVHLDALHLDEAPGPSEAH